MTPLLIGGRTVHQIGLPYHWGVGDGRGGRAATRPTTCSASPSTRTCRSRSPRSASCDIQPGRRPRGPALLRVVAEYQSTGRVTVATGNQLRTADPGPDGRRPTRDDGGPTAAERKDEGDTGDPSRRPGRRTTGPPEAFTSARPDGPGAATPAGPTPPAAQGLLHRHLDLHRLQGLRGGVQGVERRARATASRPARQLLRQHRRARGEHLAARRVHRADRDRQLEPEPGRCAASRICALSHADGALRGVPLPTGPGHSRPRACRDLRTARRVGRMPRSAPSSAG